jgi:hypothetical protein
MAYLSKQDQRQRIIEVVRRESGVNCPTLVVEHIEEAMHQVTVFYWCKEEEVENNRMIRSLALAEEDAEYIGVDRGAYDDAPEMDQ